MKRTENSAWYLQRAKEKLDDGRGDEIDRLLHRYNAEIDLMSILERCEDEEIRYLAGSALLKEGLLGRNVPDKPNSRNQRYLTARNV